jgi:septum formation protein
LLLGAGLEFEVLPAEIPEDPLPNEDPSAYAERLARGKALAVAERLGPGPPAKVVGADTIVVLDDAILGKPKDSEDAVRLLSLLVGRCHCVITAVAVVETPGLEIRRVRVESTVCMRTASNEEVRAYIAIGESLDKAGAYALQGEGRRFVERVEGSETNVIGLPLEETLDLLGHTGP